MVVAAAGAWLVGLAADLRDTLASVRTDGRALYSRRFIANSEKLCIEFILHFPWSGAGPAVGPGGGAGAGAGRGAVLLIIASSTLSVPLSMTRPH